MNSNTWSVFCQSQAEDEVPSRSGASIVEKSSENAVPEGITLGLLFQDLRGANYVASEIARVTSQTAYYRTDKAIDTFEIDDLDKTITSFGLGFNKFTHMLSELTDRELFEVIWSKTVRENQYPEKTDNFRLPQTFDLPASISDSKDYALVVRVAAAPPAGKPSRYFFICAGRTASGTAAAGYFLANNWKNMRKLYKENGYDLERSSVAIVVEHWFGHDKEKTPHANRDYDSSVKIAFSVDGTRLVKWWPV